MPQVFAMGATRVFGERIATQLGVSLSPHEEREFEDGEHKARPLVNVRGADVFVVQSLYGERVASVNDKLIRLLYFLGALRDAGARRTIAVVPYLAYARKDAKTQPRDPVTTRYVAALFEAVGTNHVVALDVHNLAAFQNAFRCRTDHLDTAALFARHFASALHDERNVVVVSPDVGGAKRAERLRRMLGQLRRSEPTLAFLEKARGGGQVRSGRLVGEVADSAAIIVDDLISTGRTLAHAARACRSAGATRVFAAAAHGLFVGGASALFTADDIEKVFVTDSVPPFRLAPDIAERKLTVLSVATLFADAIRCLHGGGSIEELLEIS